MRLSIKAKQVAGVTTIVGVAVVVLSGVYLSSLLQVRLEESQVRGELLANAIGQRAHAVVAESGEGRDPVEALRIDSGLRSILEASAYDKRVTYAAMVDVEGTVIASFPDLIDHPMQSYEDVGSLLAQGAVAQIRAIYASGGRTFEIRKPLLLDAAEFGSIRIGVSTLLIQGDFNVASVRGHCRAQPSRAPSWWQCRWRNCCCGPSVIPAA
jgi:hypothetical protein